MMMPRHLTRKLHKWIGVICCLFTLAVASTALLLNHPEFWQPLFVRRQAQFSPAQAKVWALDPFDARHLLASDLKELYHSHDGGQHWQPLKLYLPAQKVNAIAFSPLQRDKLWIALQEVGVFYSEDGGEIWEELSDLPFDPVAGEWIQSLQVAQRDSLLISSRSALYRLEGGKWSSLPFQEVQAQGLGQFQEWLWKLHTGRGWGSWGLYLYDAFSLGLIFLALSGLWLARPRRRKPVRPLSQVQEALA